MKMVVTIANKIVKDIKMDLKNKLKDYKNCKVQHRIIMECTTSRRMMIMMTGIIKKIMIIILITIKMIKEKYKMKNFMIIRVKFKD